MQVQYYDIEVVSVKRDPLTVVLWCCHGDPKSYCLSIPSSGYKLAFNYMKAQRNVDAVEVCYKVSVDISTLCLVGRVQ